MKLSDDVHSVATELEARTTGNPFYVVAARARRARDASSVRRGAVPDAVAQLVARRLDALDPDLASTLALAAVAGEDFELATIEACSSLDPDRLLDVVEALCRQRFLAESGPERFAFVHALVRDAVLATIGVTREPTTAPAARRRARRRGRRPCVARPPLSRGRFGRDARRDAQPARGRPRCAGSGGVVGRSRSPGRGGELATEVDERCEALIGLGRAQRAARARREGRATIEIALALARATATVAPRRAQRSRSSAAVDAASRSISKTRRARRCCAKRWTAWETTTSSCSYRCWASSRSRSCSPTPRTNATQLDRTLPARSTTLERRRTVRGRAPGAPDRARWGRPAPTHASPTAARHWPSRVRGRARTAARRAARSRRRPPRARRPRRRRRRDRARAAHSPSSSRIRTGRGRRRAGARSSRSSTVDSTTRKRSRSKRSRYQAPAEHPEAVAALGVNLVDIRLFQGRAGEMLELAPRRRRSEPAHPHLPGGARALLRARRRSRTARAPPTTSSRRGLRRCRPTRTGCSAIAVLADTAATLGDRDGARVLAPLLEPYADRHVVLNCFGGGGAYWGPVAHHLGRLERLLGDADERAAPARARDRRVRCDGRGRVRRRSSREALAEDRPEHRQ